MTEWPYPYRRRRAGAEVGCLLCPTMLQRGLPESQNGRGTIDAGMHRHLETVHEIHDHGDRERIVRDAVRNRPRRHDEQRTN